MLETFESSCEGYRCCLLQLFTLGDGGGVYLRSTLHLHRVTSLWEVLFTEPGAVRTQVQPSAGKVPLLEKGHLRQRRHTCYIYLQHKYKFYTFGNFKHVKSVKSSL